jgi:hypothetical protein
LCNLADLLRRRGARALATEAARRALTLLVGEDNPRLMPYPVLRLAALAVDWDDAEVAAKLLGLADALLAAGGGVIDPSEAGGHAEIERYLAGRADSRLPAWRAAGASPQLSPPGFPDLPVPSEMPAGRGAA